MSPIQYMAFNRLHNQQCLIWSLEKKRIAFAVLFLDTTAFRTSKSMVLISMLETVSNKTPSKRLFATGPTQKIRKEHL